MAGKIQIIVGGQFGSEGKGHAAAELAAREGEMLAIRTGGPNAGHTAWGHTGMRKGEPGWAQEFKLRTVPVAAVVNPQAMVALASKSLIQLDLAEREVKETGVPQLLVDQSCTILEPAHIAIEAIETPGARMVWILLAIAGAS
jgi:adenylosuccinate synthase